MDDYRKIYNIGFINILLLICGYFLVRRYGVELQPFLKSVRILFLVYSLFYLFKILPIQNLKLNYSSVYFFYFFVVLCILSSLLSEHTFLVTSKLLNFLPPVIFTIIYINTAYVKLGLNDTRNLLLHLFINSYSVPLVLSIFFNGNYYLGKNLYFDQYDDSKSFVSNHLGWSAIIVLTSAFAVLDSNKLKKYKKMSLYLLIVFSIMTIINSTSRTILFSLILYFIVLGMKKISKGVSYLKIVFAIFCFIISLNYLYKSDLDSVNKVIDRTTTHLMNQSNIARFAFLQFAIDAFNDNPLYYFTGVGLFNDRFIAEQDFMFFTLNKAPRKMYNYHNSYADIFFGGGVLLFVIFLYLGLFKSLKQMWGSNNYYYLLVIPLHSIAFTENQLLGGQFIFFPLFFFICFSNLKILNSK